MKIVLDDEGECNHCRKFDNGQLPHLIFSSCSEQRLPMTLDLIDKAGPGKGSSLINGLNSGGRRSWFSINFRGENRKLDFATMILSSRTRDEAQTELLYSPLRLRIDFEHVCKKTSVRQVDCDELTSVVIHRSSECTRWDWWQCYVEKLQLMIRHALGRPISAYS